MSASECAEVILDMERLDEVDVLACHELEDISDDTGSYVCLRYENAYILVEPLWIESCTAACRLEGSLIDIIVYVAVNVVLLCKFLDTESRFHTADEFVVFYIIHHLVLAGELICILLHLLICEVLYLDSVITVWEVVDFRTDLGEEVVVVDICAPHCLVHVCHEAYVRVAEDCTCLCCVCIDLELFCHLLACAEYGLDHLARYPLDAS